LNCPGQNFRADNGQDSKYDWKDWIELGEKLLKKKSRILYGTSLHHPLRIICGRYLKISVLAVNFFGLMDLIFTNSNPLLSEIVAEYGDIMNHTAGRFVSGGTVLKLLFPLRLGM
jgi:hypothetical protein